jgi:hypothetical protein
MKWILLSAVTLSLPICAISKVAAAPLHPQPAYSCCIEECDPDLFRKDDQVYSGHVEFLYWSLAEGGLDYALKMRHAAWGPTPSYAQGKFENATYGFDPGFRVALSYFRAPHYWEVKWQYTRMTNRGNNSSGKPEADQKFLTGTWPQITEAPLSGAKSHIHFNYNIFDMLIDRVFIPNPHLRLRVIGGGVAAWMDQDWTVQYFDSTPNSTTIQNRWHFVGAGLKTGTAVDWYWTWDLYMTAVGNFGLLMGSYSNHAKQTTTVQPTADDDTDVPIRDTSYHDIRPAMTAQMMLGPSYQKNFSCSRLEVFAGFEMNMWLNLQEIYRSTSGISYAAKETWINSSMLTLYGLTTRITFDY